MGELDNPGLGCVLVGASKRGHGSGRQRVAGPEAAATVAR
jgi:hypothetical protein